MPMMKAGKAVRLQNLNTLDGIKYFATYLYIYLLCTFKICITAKLMKVAEKIKRHSESLGGLARFTFQIDNPGLTNKDLMDSYELIGKKVIPLVNKT